MNEFVTCYTMKGEAKQIQRDKLSFRPSAYALIVYEGKLLMTHTRSTGKYSAPGGALEIGESLEQGLKRELKEECGIEVEVLAPAFFKETFFYYEPLDKAWQCHLFFFICKPLSLDLSDAMNEPGDESENPEWVDIATLRVEDIQVCGEEIMGYIGSKEHVSSLL